MKNYNSQIRNIPSKIQPGGISPPKILQISSNIGGYKQNKREDIQEISNDYGEEEAFIQSVEDDVLENKFSSSEEKLNNNGQTPINDNVPPSDFISIENQAKATIGIAASIRDSGTTIQTNPPEPRDYSIPIRVNKVIKQNDKSPMIKTRDKKSIQGQARINHKLYQQPQRYTPNNYHSLNKSDLQESSRNQTQAQTLNTTIKNKNTSAYRDSVRFSQRDSQSPSKVSSNIMSSIQIDSKELKKLREKVYFYEFVKPLHQKQNNTQTKRIQVYKKLLDMQNQVRKSQEAVNRSQDSVQIKKLVANSPVERIEIQNTVKKMKISDYYQGKKLALKKNLTTTTTNGGIQNNQFIDQIRSLRARINSGQPLNQDLSILHTDNQKLKKEFIDQEKALSVMENLKQSIKDENEDEDDEKNDDLEKPINITAHNFHSSILFNKKAEKKAKENEKNAEWNQFLKFMESNPQNLLSLIPDQDDVLEIPSQSQLGQRKGSLNLISILGQNYPNSISQRPFSSGQTIGNYQNMVGAARRKVNTGYGMRYKPGTASGFGTLSGTHQSGYYNSSIGQFQKQVLKSHYHSTGRVLRSSNHINRCKSSMEKSRPSQHSTQFTNFLHEDHFQNYKPTAAKLSSVFSINDSNANNKQAISNQDFQNQFLNSNINQSFRAGDIAISNQLEMGAPIEADDEYQLYFNRPKSSLSNQVNHKMFLLMNKPNQRGSMLTKVKLPQKKEETPMDRLHKENKQQPKSLSEIDTSVSNIQKQAKLKISLFTRSNQKAKEEEMKEMKKKKQEYSLANELFTKFKVDEWKQNPNFNKFRRQINSTSPMRQMGVIDWKHSQIRELILINKATFNEENDTKIFKEDEIEYMINMLRYSAKNFTNIDMLKPLFNKSINTLEQIMEELNLGYLFDRISAKILDITPENSMKVLVRCKMMLQTRNQIIKILQIIDAREEMMKDLNYFVIKGVENVDSHSVSQTTVAGGASKNTVNENGSKKGFKIQAQSMKRLSKEEREDILRERIRELNEITELFISKVRHLYTTRKIFGKTFVYDGMDYIRVVINEMRQLKTILNMYGIDITESVHSNVQYQEESERIKESADYPYTQIQAGSFMINQVKTKKYNNEQVLQQSLFDEIGSKETAIRQEGYHQTLINNDRGGGSTMIGVDESADGNGYIYRSSIAYLDDGDMSPSNNHNESQYNPNNNNMSPP